jgi:hypothetical protein
MQTPVAMIEMQVIFQPSVSEKRECGVQRCEPGVRVPDGMKEPIPRPPTLPTTSAETANPVQQTPSQPHKHRNAGINSIMYVPVDHLCLKSDFFCVFSKPSCH